MRIRPAGTDCDLPKPPSTISRPALSLRFIVIRASRLQNFICSGERRKYAWGFRADEIVVRAVPQTRDSDGWMNPIRDRHDVLPFDLALTDFARSVRAPAITRRCSQA